MSSFFVKAESSSLSKCHCCEDQEEFKGCGNFDITFFFFPSFLTDTLLISYDKLFCGLDIGCTDPKYLFNKYRRKRKRKAAPAVLILEEGCSCV